MFASNQRKDSSNQDSSSSNSNKKPSNANAISKTTNNEQLSSPEQQQQQARSDKKNRPGSPGDHTGSSTGAGSGSGRFEFEPDEKEQFLSSSKRKKGGSGGKSNKNNKIKERKAKLAKSETIEDWEAEKGGGGGDRHHKAPGCFMRMVKQKRVLIPLVIISCVAAIYCIPYVEFNPEIPKRVPRVAFDFEAGPLKESSASSFKTELLFRDRIHGAESVAIDSTGNMYMAIEGGFILYAHLNKSSPLKLSYYSAQPMSLPANLQVEPSDLVKIAELNGLKQPPYDNRRRARGESQSASWRRDCTLDESFYGPGALYTGGAHFVSPNELNSDPDQQHERLEPFVSHVPHSRCSIPLGVRLSADENYLYVIDTNSGLYRVSLKVTEKPHSSQRLVTKLLEFGPNSQKRHLLVPIQRDQNQLEQLQLPSETPLDPTLIRNARSSAYMNISLTAVDDLVIEQGAGHRDSDVIYLSLASQRWPAHNFLYDLLEGNPSGLILRYDTGNQQLTVLNPMRLAHVRMSSDDLTTSPLSLTAIPANISSSSSSSTYSTLTTNNANTGLAYFLGIGAPRLDENDVFDDRPLFFPNGMEITDDRSALLIADTSNKRIIKHYISGQRKGTTDLWAWTPNFPDNIRRGYDKRLETYWVVGCGADMRNKIDLLDWLTGWPKLRKYIIKNIHLFGWFIEFLGTHLLQSGTIRDFGFTLKTGHRLLESMCHGMMVLQYNSHGDLIRSIHGGEFPNDLVYFSQVSEVIDAKNQEHLLYLTSPAYAYVTKLTLPTDNELESPQPMTTINMITR